VSPPVLFELRDRRVFVAGHRGMAGSAIVRRLASEHCEVLTVDRARVDLTQQSDIERWLAATKPDAVFLAAARVGGIHANSSFPADFLTENLAIALHVVRAAFAAGVGKLLFLGSSCIYPRLAPQPMTEEALLTGPLEPTNEWYAIAKIAGIKLCQAYRRQYGCDFISAMPTNLYGPGDNYDPQSSHVAAAIQVKVHRAKQTGAPSIEIWGSGTPRREFLYVEDLADAIVFLMKRYSAESHINVGTGTDIGIRELAELVAKVAGWRGGFVYDPTKPDGMPRKVMDVSRLKALGWTARTPLERGFRTAYQWYVAKVTAREPSASA